MMGWSPRCYIPSFVKIGPPVPEKKILKGFYHIWAWRPSWSCDPDAANNFRSPTQGGATQNLSLIGQAVLEKKMFEIVNDNGWTPDHEYPMSSHVSLWLR